MEKETCFNCGKESKIFIPMIISNSTGQIYCIHCFKKYILEE